MSALIIISFIAGFLTVLAPCSLPLLPVIIGGSVDGTKNKLKPYIVVGSLAASIIIFTLLIRLITSFIFVPDVFWAYFSGGILILVSITILFPNLWAKFSNLINAHHKSNKVLGTAMKKEGLWGQFLIGASLGLVFSSCSPTYFIILAAILPESLIVGTLYLLVFVLGLISLLLPIAVLGQKFVSKLDFASNPNGWFKKAMGYLILIMGLLFVTGLNKNIETFFTERGFGTVQFEDKLLRNANIDTTVDIEIKTNN